MNKNEIQLGDRKSGNFRTCRTPIGAHPESTPLQKKPPAWFFFWEILYRLVLGGWVGAVEMDAVGEKCLLFSRTNFCTNAPTSGTADVGKVDLHTQFEGGGETTLSPSISAFFLSLSLPIPRFARQQIGGCQDPQRLRSNIVCKSHTNETLSASPD